MPSIQSVSLLTSLLAATRVAAHGHVTNIVVNGVSFAGFDIGSFPYMEDPPTVAAWTTPNTGNGFVTDYSSEDIICHQNATNAQGHVAVKAGDSINIKWTEWPESHHGPVIDYLAKCEGGCSTVDKTELKFFKIDGVGLVDNSEVPGTWGDDQLIENDNSWLVQIPESIAPGEYVLRHELIALHGAQTEGGAQNYPQCFNLKVSGSGTDEPKGVAGTELYKADGAGIEVNIYSSISSYTVPGPVQYTGASSIKQSTSKVTSTGTATAGSGSSVPSTKVAVPTASASSAPAQAPAPSTLVSATSAPAATQPAVTSQPPVVSQPPAVTSVASSSAVSSSAVPSGSNKPYAQCGGLNFQGASACPEGYTCHKYNPYYSQCISSQ
ncbi:hypothetical protein P170DRAFT_426699 [Aspergillus steynii IBT 23096]|uniref:AA9 family lytic polysaccharide monooxygenase n=1 Tax=Aspergillus steynii IBT 23096 TaxID=1392250 RepID=A0A2I2GAD2_9EURO|nr:uncharacterized protein P170DRAFT_426699 [Aspergillus steynii IBT 23096]PLB49832.1 hypothetical protein P170DRAFT_426699 [Aspergillus steynii IBT 23096]